MIEGMIKRVGICVAALMVFASGCGGGSDSDAAVSVGDNAAVTVDEAAVGVDEGTAPNEDDEAAVRVDESAAARVDVYAAAVCSLDLLGDDDSDGLPATWGEFADETRPRVDGMRALSPPPELAQWHNVNLLTLNAMAEHAESQPRDDLFNLFDLLGVGLVMASQITEAEQTVPERAVEALSAHGCNTDDWGDDPFDGSDDADPQSGGTDSDAARDPSSAWQSYTDVDDFTDAVEVGTRLEADNGFELEVECGQNGFIVRLNVNTYFMLWEDEPGSEDFALRFGQGQIEQTTWHLLPDTQWIGDDNEEWLVSPSPEAFANRLIDTDAAGLLIRHGEDEATGEFDLTGAAAAIVPIMQTCDLI